LIRVVKEQGSLVAYKGDIKIARRDGSGVVWWFSELRLAIDWDNAEGLPPVNVGDEKSNSAPEGSEALIEKVGVKNRGIRLMDKITGRFVSSKK